MECQELNALHSQSVDGANIRIPDRLKTPPAPPEGSKYILDQLKEAAVEFTTTFTASASRRADVAKLTSQEDAEQLIGQLLRSKQNSVSEFELFNLAYRLAQRYCVDLKSYLSQLDFSAMTVTEKKVVSSTLSLSGVDYPEIWNSLFLSDILTPRDLYQRNLAHPFAIQRLYSSRLSGAVTFFEYLKRAVRDYTRKLLIIQVSCYL